MLLFLLSILPVQGFDVGQWVCTKSGLNLRSAPCGTTILWSSNGNERGHIANISNPTTCSLGNYTWYQIAMDEGGPIFWAADTGLIYDCGIPAGSIYIKDVPYVSQDYDVGDSFNGGWACGPTSSLMAMAYHKKIAPKPITSSRPWIHSNDFGFYDSNNYTSPIGVTFNTMQLDASGNPAWGAYGTCTSGGEAWAWKIQEYVQNHGGLLGTFYDQSDFNLLKDNIDKGNLIVQSTALTNAGHLVLIVGYTPDGSLVINDPNGNKMGTTYGIYPNGAYVTYSWDVLKAHWCVVISVTDGNERAPLAPLHVSTKF